MGHSPHHRSLQAGIQDTATLPLTPPSHTPYLAKGDPALNPVGSLFATATFTPAPALYRKGDDAIPTSHDHSLRSLLPSRQRCPSLSPSLPNR